MDKVDEIARQLNERDLQVLLNAKNDIQKKIVEQPTADNVKSLAAINKAIEELQRKKIVAENVTFKNLKGVIEYLQENYEGVKQSTVYYHRKKSILSERNTGFYHLDDVIQYGDEHYTKKNSDVINVEMGDHKNAEQTRLYSIRAEKLEIQTKILRGEYVERAIHERALAMRAARLKSDAENDFRNNASEAVRIVNGDMTRVPDLIEWLMDLLEKWLDRYSADVEFDLPAAVDMEKLEQIGA